MRGVRKKAYSLLLLFTMILSVVTPINSLAENDIIGEVESYEDNFKIDEEKGYIVEDESNLIIKAEEEEIVTKNIEEDRLETVEVNTSENSDNINNDQMDRIERKDEDDKEVIKKARGLTTINIDITKRFDKEIKPNQFKILLEKQEITQWSPYPFPEKVSEVWVEEDGKAIFPNIPILDDYRYIVSEIKGKDETIIYDTSKYKIEFVKDGSNIIIYVDGKQITPSDEGTISLEFNNKSKDNSVIDIEGTKTWKHGSNSVEKQPKEIEVKLLQNGKERHVDGQTYSKKVTVADEWNYRFEGLPKNDSNGNPYKYTVEENTHLNYLAYNSETSSNVEGYDLHNIFIEPIQVELRAKKYLNGGLSSAIFGFEVKNKDEEVVSEANNNTFGEINFTGIKISEEGKHRFTINEVIGTDEKYIYDKKICNAEVDVFLNRATGELEVKTINYTDSLGNNLNSGVRFDNETKNKDISIGIIKKFDKEIKSGDFKFLLEKRENSFISPTPPPEKVSEITVDENGKAIFKNLEILPEDFYYVVSEIIGDDETIEYDTTKYNISFKKEDSTITILVNGKEAIISEEGIVELEFKNKSKDKVSVNIEGEKTWDDANNQDGKRPSSITVDLYKTVDGKTKKVKEMEVKPDTEENWKYSFRDLPKYEDGKEITYSVKEQKVEGYKSEINGYNIKNSYTPGKTNIEVIKSWDDGNNQDGKRPTSINVDLYKTVEDIETKIENETKTLSDVNNWKNTWTDLPTQEGGKEITYTVKESKVPEGYEVSYEIKDGLVKITNTYIHQTSELEGKKIWKDSNDKSGKRPLSIQVELWKEVEGIKTKIETRNVTGTGNEWNYKFEKLQTHEGGKEIKYYVTEVKVPSYTTEINGTTITNTYIPNKPPVDPSDPTKETEPPVDPSDPTKETEPPTEPTEPTAPTTPTEPTKPVKPTTPTKPGKELPKTGMFGTLGIGITGIGLVAGGLYTIKSKKDDEQ